MQSRVAQQLRHPLDQPVDVARRPGGLDVGGLDLLPAGQPGAVVGLAQQVEVLDDAAWAQVEASASASPGAARPPSGTSDAA